MFRQQSADNWQNEKLNRAIASVNKEKNNSSMILLQRQEAILTHHISAKVVMSTTTIVSIDRSIDSIVAQRVYVSHIYTHERNQLFLNKLSSKEKMNTIFKPLDIVTKCFLPLDETY